MVIQFVTAGASRVEESIIGKVIGLGRHLKLALRLQVIEFFLNLWQSFHGRITIERHRFTVVFV